ncbi:unnamed protein product [Phyllotreta striolata]|uniref:Uncharacterized protein n=1 Tax=Phyllotreta striolata TaxID=444603 RepID=A0A9N9XKQ9_PHYSR|nr:unnamed protein product [Phyllotreta striolata]
MCKCCQRCWESCWWNLVEERFCFDETIANYEEPIVKDAEKNNNFCENMAFYDSVSVIAGRAIVTIEPLPEKKKKQPPDYQSGLPRQRALAKSKSQSSVAGAPDLVLVTDEDDIGLSCKWKEDDCPAIKNRPSPIKKTVSFGDITADKSTTPKPIAEITSTSTSDVLSPPSNVELRRKSLSERRQSRSLHLRIDQPKEVPIIRQSSVPKFFLDTPDALQAESSLVRAPLTSLQSPRICGDGFCYDLKSVVQIERMLESEKGRRREAVPQVHRESSTGKLSSIIKLKKSKSSAGNLPHSNYI